MQGITTALWFDTEGEEAAGYYVSLFKNSRITGIHRYDEAGPGEPGTVMSVEFELDGRPFNIINGGPEYKFTEAISLQIDCDDQAEVDHYWEVLTEKGQAGPCGWCKDRYGLSWQVVPVELGELLSDPDPGRRQRAMAEMLTQGKLDVARMRAAADAGPA
jgi:predicted 3-demethylubiquinone-9 3-methyltransferase (glyoxalase superfamily)